MKHRKNYFAAELHLGLSCNQNCIYCHSSSKEKNYSSERLLQKKPLSLPEIKKIIYELRSIGVKKIYCSGGLEFFSSSYANETVKFLRELDFDITLLTNGTLFNENYFETYINCEDIRISIDSSNKETYEFVRGSNKYDSLIKKITSLIKLKSEMNSKVKIGASVILNKFTIDSLHDFLLKALHYKFDYVTIKDNFFEENSNRANYNEKAKQIVYDFNLKTQSKLTIDVSLHPMDANEIPFKKCHLMKHVIVIDPFGNVYPCSTHAQPINTSISKTIGNVRKTNFDLKLLYRQVNLIIDPSKDCNYCNKWDYEFNTNYDDK
jgi:radical SAM protein with 4Fe4S-binding SPASM domain